ENLPPNINPVGNRNMFTTECSKVIPKNTMIGIHIAITLPLTVVEIIAPTTPVETIQLQSAARMKSVSMPAAPYWAYPSVRDSPMLPSIAPTLPGSVWKPKVKTVAISTATVNAPQKLPQNTSPQFLRTPLTVTPGRLS